MDEYTANLRSLSRPIPAVETEEACQIVRDVFGIEVVNASVLRGYRDLNICVTASDGRSYALKLNHQEGPSPNWDLQARILEHLARVDLPFRVPRVVQTAQGNLFGHIAYKGIRLAAILLEYVEGEPMILIERTPELCRDSGRCLAQLNRALRGFFHPAAGATYPWDLKHANRLTQLMEHTDPWRLTQLREVLNDFDNRVRPALPTLRSQVIHNDFNPGNVFVNPRSSNHIVGVIDFGDAVYAPLICEVAVAIAFQLTDDVVAEATEFVQGYHSLTPIEDVELELLWSFVAARLTMLLILGRWRAAKIPERREQLLRHEASLWTLLERWLAARQEISDISTG